MSVTRPFRFGVEAAPTTSRDEWIESARRAEDLGYSAINLGLHIPLGGGGMFAAMATAAAATSSLRITTTVIPNDFYSPAMLALEAGTFDRLSDGRLDLGIGAGWLKPDFDALGLPFRPGVERMRRLEEVSALSRRCFRVTPPQQAGTIPRSARCRAPDRRSSRIRRSLWGAVVGGSLKSPPARRTSLDLI